ncbi:Protein of unknown function [Paenibacillus sp. UNCCL117]|uniref:CBM96 family carbohydrate-binding protein n=1 Tax=unclassified Paenibacillus TaxID=185978 RepID=UPI0008926C59|nr:MULTISPECIES: DNRLRE domain-containing protein [unclassified Paenibacillus]SDC95074.1 Protein of unknown function [Paenibacillus sp. cl123]SFW29943.1 Protein of unknown function [Paenibacillus sp. UNCCL117]
MKKVIFALLAAAVWLSVFALPSVHASDEFDALRLKYRDTLTGGAMDQNDPYIAAKIQVIEADAAVYWSTQNANKVWADYESLSAADPAYTAYSYRRLKSMALSWSLQGSVHYQNSALLGDILQGLEWLYTHRYNETTSRYGGWWWWEIGTPFEVIDVTVILYDQLTASQRTKYMNAVQQFVPAPIRTGANLTDACKIVALSGVITKNGTRIQAASDAMSQVFPYVTALDGFYKDGSFVQHEVYPYAGGYGDALLASLSVTLDLLSGSTWDQTSPQKGNVYNWVFDTFETALNRGSMMQAFMGRSHARFANTGNIMSAIYNISRMSGNPHSHEMKRLIKYHIQNSDEKLMYESLSLYAYSGIRQLMDDAAVTPRPVPPGNYQLYNEDVAVHHAPGWSLAVRNHSTRMANFESFGGANREPWYQGDGVTYLYTAPRDFTDNYFTTVDNHRLPGITVDVDRSRVNVSPRSELGGFRSEQDFVGGVELEGAYGVTSMDFKQHNYGNMDVEAKKSWFMFDDEVVAVGSGISSTSGRGIETIIDNRAIDSGGGNALTVNHIAKPVSSGWSETMTGTQWAHLEGVGGYYFPGGTTLHGLREQRARAAREINTASFPRNSEFDSAYLNLAWRWIREDATHWKLTGTGTPVNELVLTTHAGSLAGSANSTKNILTFDAASGDYYTTTKLSFAPTEVQQEAGLILYLDDDNYVSVSRARTAAGNMLLATNEVDGVTTAHSVADTFGSTVHLKLEKQGDQYSAYASGDGVSWGAPIYTYSRTFDVPIGRKLASGLFAQNGAASGAAEIEARFDRIDTLLTNHFLTLWQDHDVNPADQTYSYVLLPTMTSGQVAGYAASPEIEVLAQTESIHAVKENTLQLLGAVFWQPGGGTADYVSSRDASSVMVRNAGTVLHAAISDPTRRQSKVVVELNRKGTGVIDKDPEVTVVRLAPTIILEVDVSGDPGRSFHASISYDTSNPGLPSNAPTGLEGVYDHSAGAASLNWHAMPGAASYAVYRSTNSGGPYSAIASGLTSPAYTDVSADNPPYYYKVTASNAYGESAYSEELRIDSDITLRLAPVADTYVRDGADAANNFGTAPLLVVKQASATSPGYSRHTYLKFDLSGIQASSIVSAKLHLNGRVIDGNSIQMSAYGVDDDSWQENLMTWNTKPAMNSLQTTVPVDKAANDWRIFDVTSYAQSQFAGDKVISLGLKTPTGAGTNYDSREGGVKPYLEIKVNRGMELPTAADAYVRDGSYASFNYGNDVSLVVKRQQVADYGRLSYLKFDLGSLQGARIDSARLYVHGKVVDGTGTTSSIEAHGVDDDSWTETGITWNNKPALSSLQSTVSIDSVANGWREFDVTAYLQAQFAGDGTATIALKDLGGYGSIFSSKEGSAKPYLRVTMAKTLPPSADAYVRDGAYADLNYGADSSLVVKKVGSVGFARQAYLKFDLSKIRAANVGSAKLHVYGKVVDGTGTTSSVEAHGVDDDSWTESGITWNNKPALSSLQSTTSIGSAANEWREFDVTAYVLSQLTGNKTATIGLKDLDGYGSIFTSKEGAMAPYLSFTDN